MGVRRWMDRFTVLLYSFPSGLWAGGDSGSVVSRLVGGGDVIFHTYSLVSSWAVEVVSQA